MRSAARVSRVERIKKQADSGGFSDWPTQTRRPQRDHRGLRGHDHGDSMPARARERLRHCRSRLMA